MGTGRAAQAGDGRSAAAPQPGDSGQGRPVRCAPASGEGGGSGARRGAAPSWRSGSSASVARRRRGRRGRCRSRPPRSPCMPSSSRPRLRRVRRSRSSPAQVTRAPWSPRRRRTWTPAAPGRRRTARASAAASGRPPWCSSPAGTSPCAASASPPATRTPPWRARCACACGRGAWRPSSVELSSSPHPAIHPVTGECMMCRNPSMPSQKTRQKKKP